MVFFDCTVCGTGLKKNQVEAHTRSCRSRVFSCIDCNKEFKNEEYKSHIKCISEVEKYESKSSFIAKPNKGEVKQNAWFEQVVKAVESFRGSSRAKTLLQKLTDYPNVPRKKAKFFNFIRNSFRSFGVNDSMLDEIWLVIDSFSKSNQANNNGQVQANGQSANVNTSTSSNEKNTNSLKRKLDENDDQQVDDDSSNNKKIAKTQSSSSNEPTNVNKNGNINHLPEQQQQQLNSNKFNWIESIKEEFLKNDQNPIKLKKLIKKILKKYKKFKNETSELVTVGDNNNNNNDDDGTSQNENDNDDESFRKKLLKKLKKNSTLFSLSSPTSSSISAAGEGAAITEDNVNSILVSFINTS